MKGQTPPHHNHHNSTHEKDNTRWGEKNEEMIDADLGSLVRQDTKKPLGFETRWIIGEEQDKFSENENQA